MADTRTIEQSGNKRKMLKDWPNKDNGKTYGKGSIVAFNAEKLKEVDNISGLCEKVPNKTRTKTVKPKTEG